VPDTHLAEHFFHEIGEVGAGAEFVDVRGVLLFCGGDVETMEVRIVEEFALDAPGFAVDLLPLGLGIDVKTHVGHLEHALVGLDVFVRCGDEPLVAGQLHQHLFAIGGDGKLGNAVDDFFDFALAEVELLDGERVGTFAGDEVHGGAFGKIKDAFLAHPKTFVVSCRNRKGKDALVDAVEIDFHDDGLLLVFVLVFLTIGVFIGRLFLAGIPGVEFFVLGGVGGLRVVGGLGGVFDLFVVAFGREGRGQSLVEDQDVHRPGDGMVGGRHVEPGLG